MIKAIYNIFKWASGVAGPGCPRQGPKGEKAAVIAHFDKVNSTLQWANVTAFTFTNDSVLGEDGCGSSLWPVEEMAVMPQDVRDFAQSQKTGVAMEQPVEAVVVPLRRIHARR